LNPKAPVRFALSIFSRPVFICYFVLTLVAQTTHSVTFFPPFPPFLVPSDLLEQRSSLPCSLWSRHLFRRCFHEISFSLPESTSIPPQTLYRWCGHPAGFLCRFGLPPVPQIFATPSSCDKDFIPARCAWMIFFFFIFKKLSGSIFPPSTGRHDLFGTPQPFSPSFHMGPVSFSVRVPLPAAEGGFSTK